MKSTLRVHLLAGLACVGLLQTASAQIIFSDDFEGTMANWTATGTNVLAPLTLSTAQNAVPAGAGQSALINSSLNSMYHDVGLELSGAFTLSYYVYDDGVAADRGYAEARAYTGAGYNDGTLQQLYAGGIYSSVTMPGEVFNATVYQGRFTSGTAPGWFNLDAAGVPGRSVGWHRFDIVRHADGTTVDWYVDGTLGRSFSGVTDASLDSLRVGSVAAGTSVYAMYLDGVSLANVPEPSTWALLGLGILGLAGRRLYRRH
jgi:hypothetical protein